MKEGDKGGVHEKKPEYFRVLVSKPEQKKPFWRPRRR
jgi:hypothetical protein